MTVKKPLNHSQSQLTEVLSKSQLCANLRGYRLASNLPTNYKFVFHLSNLNDYTPLLYKKKDSKQQKKISFCKEKEIRQIYQTYLGDKYFKPLKTSNKLKKTQIRINFLDLDVSLKEITFF